MADVLAFKVRPMGAADDDQIRKASRRIVQAELAAWWLSHAVAIVAQHPRPPEESIGSVMFILKKQDVEIKNVQHPKRDQQIPILTYQGQTFRLIKSFGGSQAEEAKAYWRDLTDNRGKVCVLLQESDSHSVWGKVRLDQLASEEPSPGESVPPQYTIACILLLQAVFIDIEDLLGGRQAKAFEKDISKVFKEGSFPQTGSPKEVKQLLTTDPLNDLSIPPWEEKHLIKLLQLLHSLGQDYFGNNSFTAATEVLDDMESSDRDMFLGWLNSSSLGKMWETV